MFLRDQRRCNAQWRGWSIGLSSAGASSQSGQPLNVRNSRYAKLECLSHSHKPNMLVSKEYVGYLARQVTKKLIEGEFIETAHVNPTIERVNAALLEEMQLEDRINDEVRMILEAYQDEMQKTGASYQEMFKKVKQQLVQKYKAVL